MSTHINKQYSNRIEGIHSKVAKQSVETQTLKEDIATSFQESMQCFKERALDQIKNGEPTYAIGASEMSLKEWEKLMDKVDKDINCIKEQQKERLERKEEERKEKELFEEVQTKREETEHSQLDEVVIDKLFQQSSVQ